jgi:hypothetical protein
MYKRPSYRPHKDRLGDLEGVFRILQDEVPYGGIAKLSKLTNIADATIQRWKANTDGDPTWRLSRQAYSNAQRIFTAEQEQRLLTLVMSSFLQKGLHYSDANFRLMQFESTKLSSKKQKPRRWLQDELIQLCFRHSNAHRTSFRLQDELIQVWGEHSESGWTTSDVIYCYFWHLRHEIFPDGPLWLILDTYSAHRSAEGREMARLRGIDLVFVPSGCTHRLQPFDRRVFGLLKAYARQMWRTCYHATGGQKVIKPVVAQNLSEAWNRITTDILDSAWCIYPPGWDEDQDRGEAETNIPEYRQVTSLDDLRDL